VSSIPPLTFLLWLLTLSFSFGECSKTGIYKPEGPRGSDGMEPIEGFFDSPSPAKSVATTAAQSSIKRTAQSIRTEYYEEDEEEREEEDTSMMIEGDSELAKFSLFFLSVFFLLY